MASSEGEGSDGEGWARVNIVTDGHTKVRWTWGLYDTPSGPVGEHELWTWDGKRVMEFLQDNDPPYIIYEAPNEHPDDVAGVTSAVADIWPKVPGPGCTDLKTTKTIIGRVADGYRCTEATPDPEGPTAREAWIDQATGIQLADCYIPCSKYGDSKAEKLVLNPKINATTFSTHPPAGAKVEIIAARKNASQGQKVPDFTLDLVKGGRIGLKDLTGKPFVLAFFGSDLAGGLDDPSCPFCKAYHQALLTLQTLTGNGTKPRVLGVQEGDLGKPGYPIVVPGVTLTLAHEQNPTVQNSFGQASFVFVNSDGTIAATYDHPPTKQQITQDLASLR